MRPPTSSAISLASGLLRLEAAIVPASEEAACDKQLLSSLPGGESAWWRRRSPGFHPGFNWEEALTSLDEALLAISQHPLRESHELAAGLERQLLARMLLRLGAWKPLAKVLGAHLRLCRSLLPTPRRLGIASGLVAEWALASGMSAIARIYASESLHWGGETHRVRSYIAYATALDPLQSLPPAEDLPFFLSFRSTLSQKALLPRHCYSLLHEFRLRLLGALSRTSGACDCPTLSSLNEALEALSEHPILRALALLAFVVAGLRKEEPPQDAIKEPTAILFECGRWRDLVLLRQAGFSLDPYFQVQINGFVQRLDEMAEARLGKFPAPGPADAFLLDKLPLDPASETEADFSRRFLACI